MEQHHNHDNLQQSAQNLEKHFYAQEQCPSCTCKDIPVFLKDLHDDFHLHHDEELKLQQVSGIDNSSVLANAIDLGITVETFSALGLVPLIRVATADRKCDKKESQMILNFARINGIEEETSAYELLKFWLKEGLNPNLTLAWKNYVKTLKDTMPEVEYLELKKEIIRRCKKVARVSGTSVMGLGPITKKESDVLKDIEQSF